MNCSFKLNNYDQKTCNNAINKLRGSGSSVPKKVTGKYIYKLAQIEAAKSLKYGNKILILSDYGTENEVARILVNQLSLLYEDFTFKDFRSNVGYNIDGMVLLPYLDAFGLIQNVQGQLVTKTISSQQLKGNYIDDVNPYYKYDGSDLNIDTYVSVIVFTKKAGYEAGNNYDVNNSHIIDYYEYSPQLGANLQNYIKSGGNVILGNHVLQNLNNNSGIPNFAYESVPFIFYKGYEDSTKRSIETINISINGRGHPIFKDVDPKLNLCEPLNDKKFPVIIKNIIASRDASVLATVDAETKDIPFIAIYENPNGGKTIGINAYIGLPSNDTTNGNLNFAKIIFNAIYWFAKINV